VFLNGASERHCLRLTPKALAAGHSNYLKNTNFADAFMLKTNLFKQNGLFFDSSNVQWAVNLWRSGNFSVWQDRQNAGNRSFRLSAVKI